MHIRCELAEASYEFITLNGDVKDDLISLLYEPIQECVSPISDLVKERLVEIELEYSMIKPTNRIIYTTKSS
jgi:hypothetical protein